MADEQLKLGLEPRSCFSFSSVLDFLGIRGWAQPVTPRVKAPGLRDQLPTALPGTPAATWPAASMALPFCPAVNCQLVCPLGTVSSLRAGPVLPSLSQPFCSVSRVLRTYHVPGFLLESLDASGSQADKDCAFMELIF